MLGFVALSRGDVQTAVEQLSRADEVTSEVGILEPALRWYVPDLLDALVAADELERAEAVLEPWHERAQSLDRAWALAVSARTYGRAAERGPRRLRTSFRVARRVPGAACEDGGPVPARPDSARPRGDAAPREAPRHRPGDAGAGSGRVGAPGRTLWAGKAQAELARIGGRAPSRGELTESERRIATLVAHGRTNREVAATLFLAERSVETALTRVYRKLGVRSRAGLASVLSREGQQDVPPAG